jgi:hypothetical protein
VENILKILIIPIHNKRKYYFLESSDDKSKSSHDKNQFKNLNSYSFYTHLNKFMPRLIKLEDSKKAVCIVIDRKLREEAGRLGINISRITENVLRKMVENMSDVSLDGIKSSEELPYCKEHPQKIKKIKKNEPEEVF